jgi:hypothetical protein
VERSCERGNEPSGSIKCWELPNDCTTCGPSSGTQLHRVCLFNSKNGNFVFVLIISMQMKGNDEMSPGFII